MCRNHIVDLIISPSVGTIILLSTIESWTPARSDFLPLRPRSDSQEVLTAAPRRFPPSLRDKMQGPPNRSDSITGVSHFVLLLVDPKESKELFKLWMARPKILGVRSLDLSHVTGWSWSSILRSTFTAPGTVTTGDGVAPVSSVVTFCDHIARYVD